MPIEPFARGRRWTLYNADALDVIHTVHVEATVVVTDSPFSINTKSDGQGKLDPLADMVNAARWFADWIEGCKRIVGPQGAMWSCLNWRSMGVFQIASNRARWPITSNLIWDKDWIGPGGNQGLRPSYEMVGLYCGDNFALADRGIPDQITVPWGSHKPSGHSAEKPEPLFAKLLEWTRQGRPPPQVFDPFAGSGTSGAVTLDIEGASWVGVELNEYWAEYTARRLEQRERNGCPQNLLARPVAAAPAVEATP